MTDLTVRMIISGLCARPFPLIHPTSLPLLGYAALLALAPLTAAGGAVVGDGPCLLGVIGGGGPVSHRACMSGIVVFEAVCLFWLIVDTIGQICSYLHIPFL